MVLLYYLTCFDHDKGRLWYYSSRLLVASLLDSTSSIGLLVLQVCLLSCKFLGESRNPIELQQKKEHRYYVSQQP